MNYKEIINNYLAKRAQQEAEEKALEEKIKRVNARMERAQKQFEKIKKQQQKVWSKSVSWVDDIVKPLAEELAKKFNMQYEIFGPFGLRAHTSIYLKNDPNKSITEQKTLSISLEPGRLEVPELNYWTGEKTNHYAPGSIGDLNDFDWIMKPLPESIDEIAKLLR